MNDLWETPQDLFDKLNEEFNFNIDVCATYKTNKCEHFYGQYHPEGFIDAIEQPWAEAICWMNPPYSRGNIEKFMEKAYNESLKGAIVVGLVRLDPSAGWFKRWVDGCATDVRMLARRVKFVGAPSAYNFPCCVVVYNPNYSEYEYVTDYYIWDWRE